MFWIVSTPRADYRVVQNRQLTGLTSDDARQRARDIWFFARTSLFAQSPEVVAEAFKLARQLGFPTNRPLDRITNELVRFLENALWLGALVFEERVLPSLGPAPAASIPRDVELAPAQRPAAPLDVIPTVFAVQWVDEIGVPIAGLDVVFSVSGRNETKTTDGNGVARFIDPQGSNFALTDPKSTDGVRALVQPRWDTIREGDALTEAAALVFELHSSAQSVPLEADVQKTISVQPFVVRTRLIGGFFDTSKSFLLPDGLAGVRAIVGNYDRDPNAKLLITGHTDTAGTPSFNDPLSVERAESLKDYLTDNVGGWLKFYGSGVAVAKRWGGKEDLLMIGSLPDASTRDLGEAPVHWFQRTRGLTVDGVAGPQTRGQLIAEYMSLDGTSLPDGIEPVVHGCGENFPQDPTPDGVDDPDNRRVEVFFFDRVLGIQPPPPGPNSGPGSPEYPEWVRRSKRTDDHFAKIGLLPCFVFAQLMDDAVEVVLTNTPYTVIGQFTGLRIQGTTDSNGILRHDDLPDDYFAVQATGSVELTQVYYTERSDELGDEPWILRMRSN